MVQNKTASGFLATESNGIVNRLASSEAGGCPTIVLTKHGYLIVGMKVGEAKLIKIGGESVGVSEGEAAILVPHSLINEALAAALEKLAEFAKTEDGMVKVLTADNNGVNVEELVT